MIGFLLTSSGDLLLGSMAAPFFWVSLVSIAMVVWIPVVLTLMCGLGVQIAIGDAAVKDERKMSRL